MELAHRAHRAAPGAVLVWLAAACGAETPQAPSFEPVPVVRRMTARYESRVGAVAAHAAPGSEAREHVLGLVTLLAGGDAGLARVALEEAQDFEPGSEELLAGILTDEAAADAERSGAADLLAAMGTARAAELLLQRIEAGSPAWLGARCAWALESCGQDWVVPRLVLRLKYETDGPTVAWLARTLAAFHNLAGVEGLIVVAGGGSPDPAAGILAELCAERGLEDAAELQRRWRAGELDGTPPEGDVSDRRKLEVWRTIGSLAEWQLRGVDDARFVLSRLGAPAARQLSEALLDEDVYVRVHAGQALERMGPRGRVAGPVLVRALDDPLSAAQAALALGSVDHAEAEGALILRLDAGVDVELRTAAATALGRLRRASSAAALAALLAPAEPPDLRAAAAESLLRIGAAGELAEAPALLAATLAEALELLPSATVETSGLEDALELWLASREPGGAAGGAGLLERWRALGGAEPETLDPGERRRRRTELLRAGLLRGELPEAQSGP